MREKFFGWFVLFVCLFFSRGKAKTKEEHANHHFGIKLTLNLMVGIVNVFTIKDTNFFLIIQILSF